MSGAIMPAPLAMPLIDLGVAELDARGRDLGKGVGGHDRLGGVHQRVGAGVRDQRVEDARDARRLERLADDAGRGHEDFVRRRADRLGGGLGDMSDRGRRRRRR